MGLWQTGYLEFHENVGLDHVFVPEKILYPCQRCSAVFESSDELFEHRFAEHTLTRPSLWLNGREVLHPRHLIKQPLKPNSMVLGHAIKCWINDKEVPPEDVPNLLESNSSGYFSVRLMNQDDIVSDFEVEFAIPNLCDIREVESRFFELAAEGGLNVRRVNQFIVATSPFETAIGYVEGLAAYLYSILAKDQRGDTILSQEDGRSKANHALQSLNGFDTALSRVVIDTINFQQNAFNDGRHLWQVPRLRSAMVRFFNVTSSANDAETPYAMDLDEQQRRMQIPIDVSTNQIVEWAQLPPAELVAQARVLEQAFSDGSWVPDDRFKVRVLLALSFAECGNLAEAAQHARRVRHDTFFGEWAERLIAQTE